MDYVIFFLRCYDLNWMYIWKLKYMILSGLIKLKKVNDCLYKYIFLDIFFFKLLFYKVLLYIRNLKLLRYFYILMI